MQKNKNNTIGIIEGTGTGQEVADIFQYAVLTAGGRNTSFMSFREMFGYLPYSFHGLTSRYHNEGYASLKKRIEKEVTDLDNFCLKAQSGTSGIFRTAINAETLYSLRREVNSVKVSILPIKTGNKNRRIFFIRDQMQGYYTNDDLVCTRGKINGSFHYSSANFTIITDFVKTLINNHNISSCEMYFLYKFHLFGFELKKMIEKAAQKSGLDDICKTAIYQPDTGIHKLLHDFPQSPGDRDLCIVVGNEIGDALLETLIHFYKLGTKETFYTLNYAFSDKKNKLEILQTMHGSADDISQMNMLNPIATLNAAGYALENWLKIPGAQSKMEYLTKEAYLRYYSRTSRIKAKNTNKVVDYVLSHWTTNA